MVLRKITIDNTVRYFPITEKTKKRYQTKNNESLFASS